MQPTNGKPDPFGDDTAPEVTFQTIARQVRDMQPRALSHDGLDDVVTIVEYMRDQCLDMHAEMKNKARLLSEREADLVRREKELATRQKAVDAVLKVKAPRRWYFWR